MIGQDEVVLGKLSLTHCFQAGPSKPLLRDDHLALKSSPSHPGFEALREANASPISAGDLSLEATETLGLCLRHLPYEVGSLAWKKL